MKFTFTDKASYLAWRQEWREQYRLLSESIRAQKRTHKHFLRTYRIYETPQGKARELISKTNNPEFGKPIEWLGGRVEARSQMEILAEAKALSWTLKLAAQKDAEKASAA